MNFLAGFTSFLHVCACILLFLSLFIYLLVLSFEIPKIVMNSVALFETDLLDTFPYQPLVNASANACWIHLHIFLLVIEAKF